RPNDARTEPVTPTPHALPGGPPHHAGARRPAGWCRPQSLWQPVRDVDDLVSGDLGRATIAVHSGEHEISRRHRAYVPFQLVPQTLEHELAHSRTPLACHLTHPAHHLVRNVDRRLHTAHHTIAYGYPYWRDSGHHRAAIAGPLHQEDRDPGRVVRVHDGQEHHHVEQQVHDQHVGERPGLGED